MVDFGLRNPDRSLPEKGEWNEEINRFSLSLEKDDESNKEYTFNDGEFSNFIVHIVQVISNEILQQNETVGDLVIQVSAIDRDRGQNALVSYMFSPSTKVKSVTFWN